MNHLNGQQGLSNHQSIGSYFSRHAQAFLSSLGKIWRNPLANFMTIAVIGIALALPASLYILLQNAQAVSQGWNESTQVTMYLKQNLPRNEIQSIVKTLNKNKQIEKVTYVSPAMGLKQFQQQAGFGNVLQQLHHNPLPAVILVKPSIDITTPLAIQNLFVELKSMTGVQTAQLDMEWIKRLVAMIHLAQRAVWSLAILLGMAVMLIVGNTIRLSIQNYRREIEVTKLVGGTDAFIRRPFLYTGLIYGFAGAFIAYVFVNILLFGLSTPVESLAGLYESSFFLQGFSLFSAEVLFLVGMLLGLIGSWLAVGKQLKLIEPE